MGWSRGWVGVVVGFVVSVVAGQSWVLAQDRPSSRRWLSPEELMQAGQLALPRPILEVTLLFDAERVPALRITHVVGKMGYAPREEPADSGYVLSLHDGSGTAVQSLSFLVPNVVFDPPPREGEAADGQPVIRHSMSFALTVPLTAGAVEVRLVEPKGDVIARESLRGLAVQRQAPAFRSLRPAAPPVSQAPRSRSPWAWVSDLLVETAEAATSDGTALDIVFVGDNYTDASLSTFYQDVDVAVAHLLTYEPYVSRQSQILFHRVDNTTVDLGCVHDATVTRLITCNNAVVTSVVNDAGAPYDKIIVLVKDSAYGGSGGAIAVSYNGSSAPQVIAHEFGHTLGGLWDEYNLYSSSGPLDGKTYVNCFAGAPPASTWDGLVALTDYALGCNYPNWYRSAPCSIMLKLSCPYFNAVSRRVLDAKLDFYAGSGGSVTDPPVAAADLQAPQVQILNPSDGTQVSGKVLVEASASDDVGVARMELYIDGALKATSTTERVTASWNLKGKSVAPGAHTITAVGLDGAGNVARSSILVVK